MTTTEWLRPSEAARRFGVDESTVSKWARTGLIGHTRIGKALWVSADDIEALRSTNAVPRTAVREVTPTVPRALDVAVGTDWRESDLWRGAR